MTQQEILKYVYEMREVSPLEAKALLSVDMKIEHNDIRERMDAVSAYEDTAYANIWLWAAKNRKDSQCEKKACAYREQLLQAYAVENSRELSLTGKQCFYDLTFFAGYETSYGTLQYYESVSRMLNQVSAENQDVWFLLGLVETKKNMVESVFEYQAQITELFKQAFKNLKEHRNSLGVEEQMILLAASFEACRQHILLPYKYWEELMEAYRTLMHHMNDQDETQRAAYLILEMYRETAAEALGY